MSLSTALKSILVAGVVGFLLGGCATTSEGPSPTAESPPPATEPVQRASMNSAPAKPSELLGRPELTAQQKAQPAPSPQTGPARPAEKETTTPYGAMLTQQPRNSTVKLRPGTGHLDVTAESYSLELQDSQRRKVRLTDATEHNGLPSGEYRMRSCTLSKTDASGIEWRVRCYVSGPIRVNAGKTTTLKVGPPLIADLTTRKQGKDIIQLQLALTGESGERYVPAAGLPKTLKPPRFQVRDGRGNIIASGAFRYG